MSVERDAVVLEVGLNEAVPRSVHPLVPQSPAECAADARSCAGAGAAVAHWHARDAAGAQRLADVALHGEALDAMAGRVLAYPSYPVDVPDTVDARLAHCFALRERHGLELAPIDVGSVNVGATGSGDVIRNSLPFVVDALGAYRAAGLLPSLGAFDVGFTRTIAMLAEAGLVAEPVFCKIFLWGTPVIGPEPSVEALDLHLRQLPRGIDVEWIVALRGIPDPVLVERLCRAAIERGGGIRVGIGDNPVAHAGVSNPEVVEHAARWAADAGRPVASPDDVRRRFALPTR